MSHITIPSAISGPFLTAGSVTELRDDTGRVLGKFIPGADDFDRTEPELPPGELERRLASKTWLTTAEVLARLKDQ